ncbi:hypothetical protein IPM09_01580 [Candidatus Saccharibacteria bacterium]|nr:MAG: hypothetical protein IPM09_01580 [Candidatus Saccharibacteria bacterium]
MERPHAKVEKIDDELDHELTQVHADFIALADELLAHKKVDDPFSCIGIVVQHSPKRVLERLIATRIGSLVRADDTQLAIPEAGEHYPQLDLRKQNGKLVAVSVLVWGWDHEKTRFVDDSPAYPNGYRDYPGEIDKTRQLDINFSYDIGGVDVTESVSLYGSTCSPSNVEAMSHIWASVYAETGYEGHGSEAIDEPSDADLYEFLELVASIVGDIPESFGEMKARQLAELRQEFEGTEYYDTILRAITVIRPTQALYEITKRERDGIGTIARALKSGDKQLQQLAYERLVEIIEWFEESRARATLGG